MKKILLIFLCLAISSMLLACFDLTDEASDQNDKDVVLIFRSLQLEYQGAKYPCGAGNPILCELSYNANMANLTVHYTVDDGVYVYVDGAPLVSGESMFDFTNGVPFVMKDKKGNERTDVITIIYAENTESRLYSMSVLVYNSSTSAYDLEYPCSIDETNKKVTVAISDKTKSQLVPVKLKFVVSDYALYYINGNSVIGETTIINVGDYINSLTIKIIAEDNQYRTDYQFIVSCIDCGK